MFFVEPCQRLSDLREAQVSTRIRMNTHRHLSGDIHIRAGPPSILHTQNKVERPQVRQKQKRDSSTQSEGSGGNRQAKPLAASSPRSRRSNLEIAIKANWRLRPACVRTPKMTENAYTGSIRCLSLREGKARRAMPTEAHANTLDEERSARRLLMDLCATVEERSSSHHKSREVSKKTEREAA